MKNNRTKMMVYSLIAITAFTCFFYFYQGAAIFNAKITEISAEYDLDISLASFLDHNLLPALVSQPRLVSVTPTFQGGMLLIICLLGLPITIAYRIMLSQQKKESNE